MTAQDLTGRRTGLLWRTEGLWLKRRDGPGAKLVSGAAGLSHRP
ncbi:MAG: hypothetical protein WBQ93_11520 [Candidatus Competibacter sp.]